MHKTFIAVTLMVFLFVPAMVVAQFEGTMVVKQYTDTGGKKSAGRTMTLYFARDFFRWDQQMLGISAGSQVCKRKGNAAVMLNDEKKKFCSVAEQNWIDKKNYTGYNPFRKASVDASKTGKTKTIAGFECAEWKMVFKKRPDKEPVIYTVWTTDKLGVQGSIGFGPEIFETDIVGIVWLKLYDSGLMPMGWREQNGEDRAVTVEVVSVEKKKVDPALFEVPKGYTEVKEVSELYK